MLSQAVTTKDGDIFGMVEKGIIGEGHGSHATRDDYDAIDSFLAQVIGANGESKNSTKCYITCYNLVFFRTSK